MKFVVSRGSAAVMTVMFVALASSAFAAREAASEVGHWAGFEHSTADPGPPNLTFDLVANPNVNRFALQGTVNGLPAVQSQANVTGAVNPDGHLHLTFRNADGHEIGFCDGSVRPVANFGQGSGQDDLGSLDFVVRDANGHSIRGHMNLLHMFGGAHWMSSGFDWSTIGGLPHREQSHGAFMLPRAATADTCTFFAEQIGGNASSDLGGGMLLPAVQFAMVGTCDAHGTIIMMCDGSVRNGDHNALIGLLFTGALAPTTNSSPNIVGHFGSAGFGELLPAVQQVRGGAMSYNWIVTGG